VPLPPQICFAGEVGLSGEIRAVNRIEQRIAEAEKLGFEKIIISKYNHGHQKENSSRSLKKYNIAVISMGKVEELYQYLFQ
jgi:DNA repair protein RadA/Sms